MNKYLFSTVFFLFLSCVSSSGGIATSNIPLEGKGYKVLGPAETTLSWYSLDMGFLGIPFGTPPVDRAQQILLKKYNGDALINLRYWSDRSIFTILTRHRFHLKADVVKLGK
ncbi:MAG: hypothetical protein OEZ34_05245 [Spirochaetia bacterium]|nr:hypothetical protein [Spirochaetia bacterium]